MIIGKCWCLQPMIFKPGTCIQSISFAWMIARDPIQADIITTSVEQLEHVFFYSHPDCGYGAYMLQGLCRGGGSRFGN